MKVSKCINTWRILMRENIALTLLTRCLFVVVAVNTYRTEYELLTLILYHFSKLWNEMSENSSKEIVCAIEGNHKWYHKCDSNVRLLYTLNSCAAQKVNNKVFWELHTRKHQSPDRNDHFSVHDEDVKNGKKKKCPGLRYHNSAKL